MYAAASGSIGVNGHINIFYCFIYVVSKFCKFTVAGVMGGSFCVEEDIEHQGVGGCTVGEGWR